MYNKVCFLAGNFYKNVTGGAELQMYYLAQELIKKGCEVHYLTTDVKSNEMNVENKIIVHGVEKGNTKFVKNLLDDISPDLLYLRSRNTNISFYMKAVLSSNIPYIYAFATDIHVNKYYTIGEMWKYFFSGKFYILLKFFKLYNEDRLFLNFLKNAIVITTQNKFQYQGAIKLLNREINVLIQRNIFNHDVKHKKERFNDVINIVWIANIKPHKRPEIFLKLAQKLKFNNVNFMMVGRCTDDDLILKIQKFEQKNINFNFLGKVSQEKVFEILEGADIFINTTEPGLEGFPNSFIQAWFYSIPVISLDIDPDELIVKNDLGFYANSSVVELINLTSNLILDHNLRKQLSENSFKFASQNFSVKNYEEMFNFLKLD